MKIAIYCRVSTELQTTVNQEQFVKDYVQRLGHTIYDTYVDTYTGTKDDRPRFEDLMRDMRQHKFDAIAVYKLDRIGRSQKHLIQLFEEFTKHNIKFVSCTQNFDTSSPEGRLMLGMMILLAEYERDLLVSRINDTIGGYKKQLEAKGQFITREGKVCKHLGRPKGSKDKHQRTKSGYYRRWEENKQSALEKVIQQ